VLLGRFLSKVALASLTAVAPPIRRIAPKSAWR
jgi:hypothetical protein